MNKPRADRRSIKNATVTASMTEEERKRLDEMSKKLGLTMSAIIKLALEKFYKEWE